MLRSAAPTPKLTTNLPALMEAKFLQEQAAIFCLNEADRDQTRARVASREIENGGRQRYIGIGFGVFGNPLQNLDKTQRKF